MTTENKEKNKKEENKKENKIEENKEENKIENKEKKVVKVKINKEKKTKNIKIQGIQIEKGDGNSKYIPTKALKFIDHSNILKTLAIAIRDNLATIMIGETGTGKTSAIRYLAKKTQHGLRRINLNGGTTADELVGRLLINDKGTYWVDGVLTEAMRDGDWVVLDEINAALPEVLFVLQSIMDEDGYIVLNEKDDKEIVRKHKNFRIFATANPSDYAGTKELNKALLSRFAISINAEFPPEKIEREIIENQLGNTIANSEMAIKLIGLAKETRESKEAENTDYAINTRDILNTLRLVQNVNPLEALALAFSNKLEKADNKALQTIAKLHLPLSKKKANAKRIEVESPEEFEIGKTFIFKNDCEKVYIKTLKADKMEDAIEAISKEKLDELITDSSYKTDAVAEDEIKIKKTYYENYDAPMDAGAAKGTQNKGAKIASIIEVTKGSNKNTAAVLLHHKDLDKTDGIVKNLYKLN